MQRAWNKISLHKRKMEYQLLTQEEKSENQINNLVLNQHETPTMKKSTLD